MMFLTLCLTLGALDGPLFHDSVLPSSQMTSGSPAKDWILEVNGGGLVVGDFDGEGSLDLVLVDGSTAAQAQAGKPGLPARLLLNDGKAGFTPAGEAWNLAPGRWGMGGTAGDLNGDGRLDLVITNWGADQVFLNSGSGLNVLKESGLIGQSWGTSAALLDFDLDGVLDLYVVNYLDFDFAKVASKASGECVWKGSPVNCGPEGLGAQADQLYRGIGGGRFEVTTLLEGTEAAFGLGVVVGDFDVDGDSDLYVSNDSMVNHLWRNDRDKDSFAEVGMRLGVAVNGNGREEAGMGLAQGDLDGDGRTDFLVTNFSGESHSLYMSGGRRSYRERSGPRGVGGSSIALLGWGTGLGDFDLDGDLDLFACHGHVYPQADQPGSDTSFAQGDVLWRNTGDTKRPVFREEPLSDGDARVSRAAVMADLDRDGDLDVLNVELDGGVHLLRNSASDDAAGWLGVQLSDGARAVVGSRVEVDLEDGTQLVRELTSSAGFQASGPEEVHFGLGDAQAIGALRVRWPDGKVEVFGDVEIGQWVRLKRGEGKQ